MRRISVSLVMALTALLITTDGQAGRIKGLWLDSSLRLSSQNSDERPPDFSVFGITLEENSEFFDPFTLGIDLGYGGNDDIDYRWQEPYGFYKFYDNILQVGARFRSDNLSQDRDWIAPSFRFIDMWRPQYDHELFLEIEASQYFHTSEESEDYFRFFCDLFYWIERMVCVGIQYEYTRIPEDDANINSIGFKAGYGFLKWMPYIMFQNTMEERDGNRDDFFSIYLGIELRS